MLHEAKKYECYSVRFVSFASRWDAASHIKFHGCAIATGIRWQYLGYDYNLPLNYWRKPLMFGVADEITTVNRK